MLIYLGRGVLACERLGHTMPGIGGIYSHVTQTMRDRLRDALQHRWTARRLSGSAFAVCPGHARAPHSGATVRFG